MTSRMIASYRLQLIPEFGFSEVAALVPYLKKLGISHLYLSPITEARAGSTHGYDVIDHNRIRSEFGGREGLENLLQTIREAGLQLIFDIVPNHSGVGPRNEAWQNVLAYGKHSPFARYFDIDWAPLEETLQGKVLLPFLGKTYGEALDDGEIRLSYEAGKFYATYFENRFALSPATYAEILATALPHYERTEVYFDLKDLQQTYASLSPQEVEKAEIVGRRLETFEEKVSWQETLDEFQGAKLHELLERQCWRLAYWKTAGYEINYRRFFDINGLAALRMEDDEVFWKSHRLLGDVVAEEGVAGVRVDHVDGLFAPQAYLTRLKELGTRQIWVEKILAPRETLPDGWPVEGTTGYEFMNDLMNVLLRGEGLKAIERIYFHFVPDADSYEDVVHDSKLLVIRSSLSSELYRLAHELNLLCKSDYHTRDFALGTLRDGVAELVAALGRYRTYLPEEAETAREVVEQAVGRARQRTPSFEPSLYDFIARVILGDVPEELRERQQAWVGRFQQYTAPVAAKGVEDTAFYRYLPLVALNEVGGEPQLSPQPVQAFHSHARFRAQRYPTALLATATHDHKRGEDTRARLIALTEMPDRWEETLRELVQIGQNYHGLHGPSRLDEYLFHQLLVALWKGSTPESLEERLTAYMQKASRESKLRTSWNNPNESYEKDLDNFVRSMLADARTGPAIESLSAKLADEGFFNSLSQVVLKFTSPGVPDIYQGCELADLSLVDPDNRRPVDYERRKQLLEHFQPLLEEPQRGAVAELIEQRDETVKFYLTARLLRLRGEYPELFASGSYRALEVCGPAAECWIAFAREQGGAAVVVAVSRFPCNWQQQQPAELQLPADLAGRRWTESLSGAQVCGTVKAEKQKCAKGAGGNGAGGNGGGGEDSAELEAGSVETIDLTALGLRWAVLTSAG
ncbi:malto-oligosyltrehalose synthase [Candidatus Laterigemmans baculatus]|uniref:malto-oligosyltrehalose synthase n=1 Tax=Candidatus Laterigemmans baculatus TaxID=2770505 RepID=UPI00193B5BA9|nr:malto-oligosyltrehalose synthase [Candidatus Laterigemmans baculatus]